MSGSDGIFNIAKGRLVHYNDNIDGNDPTNSAWVWVLLKVTEADATLIDYDDLNALLGAAGNTEADFTNYAREVQDDTDATPATVDDTNDRIDVDLPDWTISNAGGASNNTLVKALLCYDGDTTGGTDANIIPVAYYDIDGDTNGGDLTINLHADGAFRAA